MTARKRLPAGQPLGQARDHRRTPRAADDEGVDGDRDQDDQAVDALQPERVDADQGQAVLDHQQGQGAERHAQHGAGAAADGDAADHDRGDDGELEAQRHAGVDGGVARGPQRAVEAGEQARAGEGAEHAPPHADADQLRRRPGWSRSRTARGRPASRRSTKAMTSEGRQRDQHHRRARRRRWRWSGRARLAAPGRR